MLVSLIISSNTILKFLSNKLISSVHSVKKKINSLRKKPIDHHTNVMKTISPVKIQPKFVLNQLCFKKYQKTLLNM